MRSSACVPPRKSASSASRCSKNGCTCEEIFAGRGEAQRGAFEELRAGVFLERAHLAADGGLLDAVRDVADGRADAAVFGDIVEQLEVVHVHRWKQEQNGARRTGNVVRQRAHRKYRCGASGL